MAKTAGRLTALRVARATKPGMYADGAGLYLQVTSAGAKSWIYRYSLHGKAREMGLGSLTAISLSDARTKAGECRRMCHEAIDPIGARKAARSQSALEAAKRGSRPVAPGEKKLGPLARKGACDSTADPTARSVDHLNFVV
jgi:Arm DNA-binding domain